MKETIEDIIANIRKAHPEEEYPSEYGGGIVPNEMRDLADHIENACKPLKSVYVLEAVTPEMSYEYDDDYMTDEDGNVSCYRERIGCFSSVEKAEAAVKRLVELKEEEVKHYGGFRYFGFVLDEVCLDDCFDEYSSTRHFESRRSYLSDGTLNCYSDLDFACKKKFAGRDEPQKVKKGDYVLVLTNDRIVPMLMEETSMTKDEWAKRFKPGVTGDFTDDSGLAFGVIGGHDHPFAPNVFPTSCLECDIFTNEVKDRIKKSRDEWLKEIESN